MKRRIQNKQEWYNSYYEEYVLEGRFQKLVEEAAEENKRKDVYLIPPISLVGADKHREVKMNIFGLMRAIIMTTPNSSPERKKFLNNCRKVKKTIGEVWEYLDTLKGHKPAKRKSFGSMSNAFS